MINSYKDKRYLSISLLALSFLLAVSLFQNVTYSVDPNEFLEDQKLELRARLISKNIRCLVCQNQSIDDSEAELAKDLRILIRKKILDGDTDDEIYSFLIKRYGEFILLKPQLKLNTLMLWALPFVFAIIGIIIFFNLTKKSKKA